MLMMLVYTPYVIRHLIATTRTGIWTWIWSAKHWTRAGSGLLISMLEKPNLFCLTGLIALVLLMLKWLGMFLKKKHILWCWGWLSLINWIGALTLSPLLKLSQRKLDLWFVLWSFFLLRLLWMSVYLPYSHTWSTVVIILLSCLAGAPTCYLKLLEKRICRIAGPSLAACLEPLARH